MRNAAGLVRLLGVLAALTLVAMVSATAALADDPPAPAYGPSEEYGFVEDWAFAEATGPVTFDASQSMETLRSRILAAPKVTQAGAHPAVIATGFKLRLLPGLPEAKSWTLATKDLDVDAPAGLVGSATAVPKCTLKQLAEASYGTCPLASQVGVNKADITTEPLPGGAVGRIGSASPVYMMTPAPGSPARLGFRLATGEMVLLDAQLRSDGDYGLRVSLGNSFTNLGILQTIVLLWGVPWDPIHDSEHFGSFHATEAARPLITNPTYCDSGPLPTIFRARSWKWLQWESETYLTEPGPSGCEELRFGGLTAPVSLGFQPDSRVGGEPTGAAMHLQLPYNPDPKGLAYPALRNTVVEFPVGVTLNSAAANRLQACSEAQIGLKSLAAPSCPDASRLGAVELSTPLLAGKLSGALFLAEQDRNPLGALMAVYLYVHGEGVQAKLAGEVRRDPQNGQITATFKDSPQVLFTDMDVRLKSGDHAAMVAPSTCGTFTTKSTLTPWSYPYSGPAALSTDSFDVRDGCVSSPAQRGFAPTFAAGVQNPVAGASSTFAVRVTRSDADQEFNRVNAVLPKGLTGKLKGIPPCSEQGIAQAIGRDKAGDGQREMAGPSCPAASRIGRTQVGVGAGPSPYYAGGDIYLAGPYKGAPLSLAFIVPAVAGPFDLGVQVVRVALRVDPKTAAITAASDPIPSMLEGVPLRVRDIRVITDRPDFVVNPTDCSEQAVGAVISGADGAVASKSSRFQVGECAALGFKPNLSLKLKGATRRGGYPALQSVVKAKPGQANIGRVSVALPHSAFLEQAHIRTICTRVQFAAGEGNGAECPKGSIYGRAEAVTPLLDKPLKGNVYLRSSSNPLPDMVVALNGPEEQPIKIELAGRIDSKNGGIRTTFETVPDAPVAKFTLKMQGGKKGLIVNSRDLCTTTNRATVKMRGQNGASLTTRPKVAAQSCKKASRKKTKSKRPRR